MSTTSTSNNSDSCKVATNDFSLTHSFIHLIFSIMTFHEFMRHDVTAAIIFIVLFLVPIYIYSCFKN